MNRSSPRFGHISGATPDNNIIRFIECVAHAYPDRPALRWVEPKDIAAWDGRPTSPLAHKSITFGAFYRGIEAVSAGLFELGIRHGDRVIVFLPMDVRMYTAMFAVQRLGAIVVFLDSWARRNQLGASAECVAPRAMISMDPAFQLIRDVPEFAHLQWRIVAGPAPGNRHAHRLEDWLGQPAAKAPPVAAVEAEHTALITFTTGSSGKPKGANRTHRFLAAQHEVLSRLLAYTEKDSDLPVFPIFSLNSLACGVTTILPAVDLAAPSGRDAAALTAQLLNERIPCATLSPSMLVNVARFCGGNRLILADLRRVVTGGAPISCDTVREFKAIAPSAQLWILYGSTEVEPMAHIEADELLGLPRNPDPEIVEEGVNVGHLSADLQYKFIRIARDAVALGPGGWAELEVPLGEVGELIVTGAHVCRDYYNNPEAFRRAKIVDPDGRVWHRTGDLARLDAQGRLWLVGRVHNVITRGGRHYFPVRAEVILGRVPGVKRAAFLGLPDAALGERTAVAIEPDAGQQTPPAAVREIVRLFSKNGIPVDSVYFVANLPMDPRHHSKVEYDLLRRRILETPIPNALDQA